MFTKIWERYFLHEFAKIFFLFLFCFYGLYVLIDYASHTSSLPHHQVQIHGQHLLRYYFYVFASRIEILVPIALLIAFIKTVTSLNSHRELVAFLAGGIKLQTLMRPFMIIALFCMGLIYLNEQFLLPDALRKLRRIEDATKQQKSKYPTHLVARHLILEDGSLLLFQSYDTANELFFDAYWVESIDSIFRIKYLSPHTQAPMGQYVDHLVRQPNGELIQQASYTYHAFPEMQFNKEILQSTVIEPDVLAIYELGRQVAQLPEEKSEKESKLLTAFYWKLTIPWLCLLAVLIPAPYCVRFSRQSHVFFIYVASLFGLIAFYLYLDAVQVVANRQVLPPFWAICFPYLLALGWAGRQYVKLR
ncbi:MAG: LptF/LptG family permease [Chlamydiales bacterium]